MTKLALLLSFFILSAAFAAPPTYQYELRDKANGNQEMWFLHPDSKERLKLGDVEVWKKGTRLFHWANATPEQAQAWNEAGKISERVLENLKLYNIGASGGGFYASLSPTDSLSYGNTQVIVTLPKDTRVLRTGIRIGVDISAHARAIERLGFSVITVNHLRTWVNIVDAEALTKEFIANEKFYRSYQFEKLPKPDDLKKFLTRFPGLEKEAYYKGLMAESKQLRKDFASTNHDVFHAAILKAIDRADSTFLRDLLAEIRPTYVTSEIVSKLVPLMKYQDQLFAQIYEVLYRVSTRNKNLRYQVYFELIRSSYPPQNMRGLLQKMSQKDSSNLLNEGLTIHRENLPKDLKALIDEMKQAGTWKPDILCSKIFAS